MFAPDTFSLIIVCAMCLMLLAAFLKGIWMVLLIAEGFRTAGKYIQEIDQITAVDKWQAFRQAELIFHNRTLDSLWEDYREITAREQAAELMYSDLEYVINEDTLALHCWKSVIVQVPGSLTALGLIGTFLGLILGISGIAFSSVDAAISSITLLLAGIETAFYTSIVGVILSLVFNISQKFAWNTMMREMGIYLSSFHMHILPEEEQQRKIIQKEEYEKIISCLERLPKSGESLYAMANGNANMSMTDSEKALMSDIWAGLQNGDFTFFIQPRFDLNNRKITGGEALMRWNNSRLGIVSPTVFLSTLEKNGYIVKLDCRMWEDVCQTINAWIQKGIRPVPISVNVSKMDILVMDVAECFTELINRYKIPPQYLQIEIAENAYNSCYENTFETEEKLRQAGFYVIINGAKGEYDTISLISRTNADALKLEYGALEAKLQEDFSAISEIADQGRKARVKLIASGIESVKQATTLKKAGFSEGQGYFLYKPVDVSEFVALLEEL